jgi:hypothetical protein
LTFLYRMEQTGIDMQVKHHINTSKGGKWQRCRRVELRDGVLRCELDFEKTYVLVEAYRSDPHVEFANAKTDEDLVAFARRWGPPFTYSKTPGVVELDFAGYRVAQGCFAAVLQLLDSAKRAKGEREELLNFISAEQGVLASASATESEILVRYSMLREEFHIKGSIEDWVENADIETVRAAVDHLIPHLLFTPKVQLACHRSGKQARLEAEWNVYDLGAALDWMVWYDEFQRHPLLCCPECRRVFRSPDGRARKFCPGGECAHRATARNWQKGYNKRKRSEGK